MNKEITATTATHANHYGYSDVHPYEIVRVISDKTIEVRRMEAELLNKNDLEFVPGGFMARCVNQRDQKYSYTSNPENEVVRLRLRKDGYFYSSYGYRHKLSDHAIKFHDFNF